MQEDKLKSKLVKNLQEGEILEHIKKWDLKNASPDDRLLISKLSSEESQRLQKEFNFKGNYELVRQIDAQHIAHTLAQHGDEISEASRGQEAISLKDIAGYENIIKSADTRELRGKRIIYKKQINGHFVVVEEALTGKNRLGFVTMWKSKGKIKPPTS